MNSTSTAAAPPRPDPDLYFGEPVLIVAIITIILSTLATAARCWSRAFILGVFGLEDWLLLLGWVCAVTVSAGNIAQLHSGLGHMFASLSPAAMIQYLKLAISINIVYAVTLTSVKLSILFLYLRALKYDYVHVATKVMLAVVAITHIWIIVSLFTVCVPLDAFWDLSKRPTSYCHKFSVYWSHSGINISTDILIFILPLTVVRKLQIPTRQKTALYLVFMLAFIVCIISIVRTLLFIKGITLADRATVMIACWTMLEVNIAVVCACLTTMKPLLSRLFPRLLLSYPEQDTEGGIETIGHARQNRRGALDSDLATVMDVASGAPSTATEATEMADLEAQKSRGSSGMGPDHAVLGSDMVASKTTLVERTARSRDG